MAHILLCDSDAHMVKSVTDILKSKDGYQVFLPTEPGASEAPAGAKDKYVIHYAATSQAILDVLQNTAVDMIFCNVALVDDSIVKWIEKVGSHASKASPTKKAPLVLMGKDQESDFMRAYMGTGIADYLAIPLDASLFLQKVSFLLAGKVEDRQVYSFPTTQPVDVGFVTSLEEISEFGATIKTPLPIKVDDVVIVRSEAFAEKGSGEVLGRCYAVEVHSTEKTFNRVSLSYFGVSNAQLKSIRKWLRTEYARKKAKEAA
jgi:DNA-binding NarL/FixJ family response regulator